MKLIDQIRADRITAFKNKENIKRNILGCLITDACKTDKEPDDTIVFSLIKKYIENCQIVIEKNAVGSYAYFQASMEIDILEAYQPEQLTEEQIRKEVDALLNAHYRNIGEIMKFFKEHYPNQYDGKLVSKIVKELI